MEILAILIALMWMCSCHFLRLEFNFLGDRQKIFWDQYQIRVATKIKATFALNSMEFGSTQPHKKIWFLLGDTQTDVDTIKLLGDSLCLIFLGNSV